MPSKSPPKSPPKKTARAARDRVGRHARIRKAMNRGAKVYAFDTVDFELEADVSISAE